jgi:acyl-CoA reductase-like NAD-dependent aldehyde dehydrogenase
MQRTVSPVDGKVYVERRQATTSQIEHVLLAGAAARKDWKGLSLEERRTLCSAMVDAFVAEKGEIAEELSWQMGRPVRYTPIEVGGFEERARYMISIAEEVLSDIVLDPKQGFSRFILREPLGAVFTIAPWNYPYLVAVNSIVPALMAGNVVLLKHSSQTPLCAERILEAAQEAGFPEGVLQYLHLSHDDTARIIRDRRIDFVAFTGSVRGGHAVQETASERFIGTGLELGGKDPAYVRGDANLMHAVENVIDGAFYNSGQSCCAIERIYAHADIYEDFLEGAVELVKQYRLGNPMDPETTLGPVVRASAADFVRGQIEEAKKKGAKTLIDPGHFPAQKEGTPYLAPQVLVNVDHTMRLMKEESFGPIVGVMKVKSDEEAVELMNDSEYGLTASIWTSDSEAALRIGNQLETGTVFMNRCDYLDPGLAWTGVKNSGRGCSLSKIGYEQLTRPKSFHLRREIA